MWTLQRSSLIVLVAMWTAAAGFGWATIAAAQDVGGQGGDPADEQSSFISPYPLPCPDPSSTSLACIRRLPDGALVCVNRKCITRVAYDHVYVEEADRSAGIRIVFAGFYPSVVIERGNLISLSGKVGTIDGERVIYAQSEMTFDTDAHAEIGPLGMTTSAIMGWPADYHYPEGARVLGLVPTGLFVRVCGRVTTSGLADEEGYFFYTDDGWQKKDGADVGAAGVRVYCMLPPEFGDYLVSTGVLSTKMIDPTPQGPSGDEFTIPVIHCDYDMDPYPPSFEPQSVQRGPVSGRVRLVGEAPPGKAVRIYTQNQSVLVENVTDEFSPFTLSSLPPVDTERSLHGGLITASTKGYVSDSRDAASGDTNVDFVLTPASLHIELKTDKGSVAICSSEQAVISAMLRDCEGKGMPGRQVKLTATKGSFIDEQEHPSWIIKTTDDSGFITTPFVASPDGVGIATITATDEPDELCANHMAITLSGPVITMSAYPRYMSSPDVSAITAVVTSKGAPIPYAPVTFKTDLGTFQGSGTSSVSTIADSYGVARATLVLNTTGTANVIAVYTNPCSQQTVSWTVVAYKSAPWVTSGVRRSNPLVVDLDGAADGNKEIVLVDADGNLKALTSTGAAYWTKQYHSPGDNTPSCAVLATERSGRPCIFMPDESQQKVFAFAYDGSPLAGWPVSTNYRFIRVAAAVGDANLDGTPEVIAGDECCYVFSWNPTGDWKKSGIEGSFLFRNITASASTTIANTTCALGDVGIAPLPTQRLGVFVGSNHATALFGFPGDAWGDLLSAPLYLDGFPKSTGGRAGTSPAIGDIDGDGRDDLAIGSDDGSLYILSSLDGSWKGYPTGGTIKSSPAMADLNGDGQLDAVVVGADSGRLFAFTASGESAPGWGGGIKLNTSGDYPIESSPVVADVNADGKVEIVVGCNDGNVYAVYADGIDHMANSTPTGPLAWVRCCIPPNETTAQMLTSPIVDDIDGDGKVEVLAAGDKGVYLLHFNASYDAGNVAMHPWPTFHANNQRTGCTTPLPPLVNASIVGVVTKDNQPALNAKVYIFHQDGSPVYQPQPEPPVERGYVLTTGTTDPTERGKGAYCINQLAPNQTYKIRVELASGSACWVENIVVTTGCTIVDIALP